MPLFTRDAPINKFFDLNIFLVETDKLELRVVAKYIHELILNLSDRFDRKAIMAKKKARLLLTLSVFEGRSKIMNTTNFF